MLSFVFKLWGHLSVILFLLFLILILMSFVVVVVLFCCVVCVCVCACVRACVRVCVVLLLFFLSFSWFFFTSEVQDLRWHMLFCECWDCFCPLRKKQLFACLAL